MSMPKPRVKLNRAGVVDLLKSRGVSSVLKQQGEAAAARMASSAPRESGALAASHRVWVEEHGDRNVVHVGSDLDYAARVALRTGYMARALDGA